jgi:hypothetical protein
MKIGGTKVRVGKDHRNKQQEGPSRVSQKAERDYLNGPLTLPRLRHETRAATNLAYRPTERAINAEKRASVQRTKDIGNWWNEYLQTVQGNQDASQAAYANAAQQGQAFVSQANAADNTSTAKLDSSAAADAALRGQTPSAAPTERAAAAQAQRNYLSAAMGGATATQGANQFAYLGEQKRIGKGQSIASRQQEQKRTRSIESDKRELAKQRGDYAAKFRGEAIDKNHDYLIQLKAFGLDKKKAGQEAAEGAAQLAADAASRAEDSRQQQIDNRFKQRELNEDAAKARREEKGGGKTQAERNDAMEGRQNAAATAKTLFEKKEWPSWGALTQAVAKESEVSPTEARAAVKKIRERIERQERKSQVAASADPNGASLGR